MAFITSVMSSDLDDVLANTSVYDRVGSGTSSKTPTYSTFASIPSKDGQYIFSGAIGVLGTDFTYGEDDDFGPGTGWITSAYVLPLRADVDSLEDLEAMFDPALAANGAKFFIEFDTPIAVVPKLLRGSHTFYNTLLAGDDTADLNVYVMERFAGDGTITVGPTDGANDTILVNERAYTGADLTAGQRLFQEEHDNDQQYYVGDFFELAQDYIRKIGFVGTHLNGGDDVIVLNLATPTIASGTVSGVTAVGDLGGAEQLCSVTGGNDKLIGSALGDTLIGDVDYLDRGGTLTGGKDVILGGGGADQIWGEVRTAEPETNLVGGDDIIDGGAGIDRMYGQTGNDMFLISGSSQHGAGELIDGGSGFDRIVYNPVAAGDTLQLSSLVTAIESVKIGNLLVGNIDARSLTEVIATLRGNDADNVIQGSQFGELIVGQNGADVLSGNEGGDVIVGGDGNDTMAGGAGSDEQYGGAGNDLFEVRDDEIAADEIYDGAEDFDTLALTGGLPHDMREVDFYSIEAVSFEIGFSQDEKSLIVNAGQIGDGQLDANLSVIFDPNGASVLQIDLAGLEQFDASGFSIQNATKGDGLAINGTSGSEVIIGSSTSDVIVTGAGRDQVSAGDGSDAVNGGGGSDVLEGNGGKDKLVGGRGSDQLSGGEGKDRLEGGGGNDTFAFFEAPNARDADLIVGFSTGQDRIVLNAAAFGGNLPEGQLSDANFVTGTAAVDGESRVIFDAATGILLYDSDGTGSAAALKFAKITNLDGTLSAADFVFLL